MPMVVESRRPLERFAGWQTTVVRLTAPPAVLEGRIRRREIGAGLEWHLARAVELQAHWIEHPVEDFLVETDERTVRDIALEVLERIRWLS